jgi:hypothetical protein
VAAAAVGEAAGRAVAGIARLIARALLHSASAAVFLVPAYYLLPLDASRGAALAWLVGGLAAVAAVLAWQVRAIMAAPYPRHLFLHFGSDLDFTNARRPGPLCGRVGLRCPER